ncbi:MAG: ethanolamine ammonia-lyase subunit EutC [Firmicutes bacterium]|nr:ethanolamine ammonia-lyase subunit EutC [Bacillota bacterium]
MANYQNDMERLIVESVLAELRKNGAAPVACGNTVVGVEDGAVDLPDISRPTLTNAKNFAAVEAMKTVTNARIGLGRCGTRQRTDTWIRFQADHAVAQDAVFMDVSDAFLAANKLETVTTRATTKADFLREPNWGTQLSEEGRRKLNRLTQKGANVQIIVADGLSSSAIEANIPEILPPLVQGLQSAGISVGTPVFIKNGRVRVMDDIGIELGCDVVLNLIGERPGLGTASSMSAYLIYRPTKDTVEADRTLISNIYAGGTPPVEAGAQLVDLIKDILKYQCTGVKLNEFTK